MNEGTKGDGYAGYADKCGEGNGNDGGGAHDYECHVAYCSRSRAVKVVLESLRKIK